MKIKQIFDLTQPLYHNCPCWPDLQPPTIEKMLFIPKSDANVEKLNLNTHTATHVDAPYHKLSDGITVDQIPVDTWIGEGIVADVDFLGDKDLITAEILEETAAHMIEGDIVMLHTGWGSHRAFTRKYLKDWPALDETGARWLVKRRPGQWVPMHSVLIYMSFLEIQALSPIIYYWGPVCQLLKNYF